MGKRGVCKHNIEFSICYVVKKKQKESKMMEKENPKLRRYLSVYQNHIPENNIKKNPSKKNHKRDT